MSKTSGRTKNEINSILSFLFPTKVVSKTVNFNTTAKLFAVEVANSTFRYYVSCIIL